MFRSIADFAEEWQTERSNTLKLMRHMTDASLSQAIVPGGRTLGFLAWHLTTSFHELLSHTGLSIAGPAPSEPVPASAAEIARQYELTSASVLDQVTSAWSDDMVDDDIPAYGQSFKRGFMLDMLIRHEAHHRGQMTVLMRQAGLPVAGPYGPAREEWIAMGMEALP